MCARPVNKPIASIMAKGKVISFDTSVIIAALLSPTGGSSFLIRQNQNKYSLTISDYALTETLKVLGNKFSDRPELETNLFGLLVVGPIDILTNEPLQKSQKLEKIIEKDDAPILASAITQSDYLISLDKHFLGETVREHAAEQGLTIYTPGEFIVKNRKSTSL